MISDFDRVTDPTFLQELSAKSLDDIRAMRNECQVLENSASYVRRFVQGRLDVVASARIGQIPGGAAEISDVIGGSKPQPQANPRPPHEIAPDLLPSNLLDQLDAIISSDELVALEDVPAERLDQAFEALTDFEQHVSSDRKKLHETIDQLQAEIVRRYRSGEANVDRLLAD